LQQQQIPQHATHVVMSSNNWLYYTPQSMALIA